MRSDRSIHTKTENTIISELKEKAASYVPEWRFDSGNPDIGSALGVIFARMHKDTLDSYGMLGEKLKRDFFRSLNTEQLPPEKARGYVYFGLATSEVAGTELSAGTMLTSDAVDENGDTILLKTTDDVFVSPAQIRAIYESNDGEDYIGRLMGANEEQDEAEEPEVFNPVKIFSFSERNVQKHVWYIGHPTVLSVRNHGSVVLRLYEKDGEMISDELQALLADRNHTRISFGINETEYEEFDSVESTPEGLILSKSEGQSLWEMSIVEDTLLYWIRIDFINGCDFDSMGIRDIDLSSRSSGMFFESVNANNSDAGVDNFFPFGEQFSIYNEVSFASDEVFSKAGAEIRISFWNEYASVPVNVVEEETEPDWKPVMPINAIKPEPEYDITIQEVVWEYFNGKGWVKLFPGKEYSDIFNPETGMYRQKKTMVFTCPPDIYPVVQGGYEGRHIRARVIKINNAYKTNGRFISPVIDGARIAYEYKECRMAPMLMYTENNVITEKWAPASCLKQMYPFYPVQMSGSEHPALYIGSDQPWKEGPVRILFSMKYETGLRLPPLLWEYESDNRWVELNPVDETENFARTGLLSFPETERQQRRIRFGENLYWLRITDYTDRYRELDYRPVFENICVNAVKAEMLKGGENGNLAPGLVTGLDISYGFVNEISNPAQFYGGIDEETEEEAAEREAASIRHGFRAVTAGDYEKIAMEAVRKLDKAKCLCGFNHEGRRAPGNVVLCIMPALYRSNPHSFYDERQIILDYMKDKIPAGLMSTGRFHVVEPHLVKICLNADIGVEDFDKVFECRHEVKKCLDGFFDPVKGNFDGKGWDVGTVPRISQIENLIRHVDQVKTMRKLVITGIIIKNGQEVEVQLSDMEKDPFVLPVPGDYELRITVV